MFIQITQLVLILAYLGGSPSAVAGDWIVKQEVGNLRVYSEAPLNIQAVSKDIASVGREFASLTGLEETPPIVEIIVFRSVSSYRNYLAGHVGTLGNRRAIFYRNGDIFQIYAVSQSQLAVDLRHEYTHALLHFNLPYVPLWIDEGLAEFLEVPASARAGSKRLRSVRWKSRTGWSPSLVSLERIPSAEAMDSDAYRDSWAWVHYIASGSPRSRQIFVEFLSDIHSGAAPGDFSDYLERNGPAIGSGIGSYFRRIRFSLGSRNRQ